MDIDTGITSALHLLTRKLSAGKYRGQLVGRVYKKDPEYIGFCLKHDIHNLSPALTEEQRVDALFKYQMGVIYRDEIMDECLLDPWGRGEWI